MRGMEAHPHALEPATADHARIWDIWFSSNILPLVTVADEEGVFPLLAGGPLTRSEVAAKLDLSEEWVEVLLGGLAALQLLRVQDGKYHLTDTARCFLLPDGPYYTGFTLSRFARNDQLDRMRRALRSPQPNSTTYVVKEWQVGEEDPAEAASRTRVMHGLAFPAAVGMARTADFSGVRRLLDVAGGSAAFSIALAQRYPAIRCTVAELPVVCGVAQGYIDQYGVAGRVDTTALNMFFEDWPTGFDAVFMSCVLHDWALDQRRHLIGQSFAALPTGGRIFIHEMLLSDSADGPFGPAMFSLNMRVGTMGKQFSAPELRQELERVGFVDATVANTHGYFSLMTARKP
jgi:hypothetical protein